MYLNFTIIAGRMQRKNSIQKRRLTVNQAPSADRRDRRFSLSLVYFDLVEDLTIR